MKITRRELLKQFGMLGGASILLPLGGCLDGTSGIASSGAGTGGSSLATAMGMGGGSAAPSSPVVTPFQVPLPIPPILAPVRTDATTDYYEISMREAQTSILPGLQTTVWGYNGMFPGPTIKARSGRQVVVRQLNNLPAGVSVHLHGGHVPGDMDGHPMDLIPSGGFKDYVYPNNQIAANLWYHDHAMDATAEHVYKGLAGFYLIGDGFEDSLPLPKDQYDVALAIQDRRFNADGSFNYVFDVNGVEGDTILVNGAVQPYFRVDTRRYRFRILNGSNARAYTLALSNGQPFIQIGHEGGLLPAPVIRTSITLQPAERADVVIDFGSLALDTQIVLNNTAGSGSTAQIMRFDVSNRVSDTSTVPSTLRPYTPLSASQAAVTRQFVFSRNMNGTSPWVINGNLYDPNRVDASVRLGSTEIWELSNRSNMPHPVHIHDVMFQVLDRNGNPPPAHERGWKETVTINPMETVRVILQFTDYTGVYVFHCHILEHEDFAMMGQFQVS